MCYRSHYGVLIRELKFICATLAKFRIQVGRNLTVFEANLGTYTWNRDNRRDCLKGRMNAEYGCYRYLYLNKYPILRGNKNGLD